MVEDSKKRPLEEIISEIHEIGTIYDIHFCKAGVGFKMYYGDGTEDNFRDRLSVKQYYKDIRTASEQTLKMLKVKNTTE